MNHKPSRSQEMGLESLENRVVELIELCQQLKTENQALRNQQGKLMGERASLMQKNELARSRIESMIMRLKSMEQEYGQ